MNVQRYRIIELSARAVMSYAVLAEDRYEFHLDEEAVFHCRVPGADHEQDSNALFYQLLCLLQKGKARELHSETVDESLTDIIFYMNFQRVFDTKGLREREITRQKKAKDMFRPEGITLDFGKGPHRYIAFERSGNMSRNSRLSFIRVDFYEPLRKRIMMDLQIKSCQISKLYAYNGLMLSSGTRIEGIHIEKNHRIIVIDNFKEIAKHVFITTVDDRGSTANPRKFYRRETILLHETTNAGANLHWLTISKSSAPSENDMTDARPGDGFVVLEWTGAFAATSYEVWYGTESGNYTNHIVTSEQYAVVSGLTNGTKYYFAVRGVNDEGTGGYSNEMTATPVPVANKKVLYYVDSGNLGLVPLGNQMGVYQSTEDQAYGVDPVTGKQWGYTTDGAPWLSGNPMPENSVLVANNKDIQQLEGKGIHYGFELENGTYTVEITFYDEWRVKDRLTDIYIEQTAVKEGYNGGIGTPETLTFTVKVEDGKLEIDLLGAKGNKDNIMVASIKIIKE